jgi:hypothetical protein
MSARLRMMQRKSIHEPKQTKDDGHQLQAQIFRPESSRSHFDPPPATQIIDRPAVGRSALAREVTSPTPECLPAQQLIVKFKLNSKKRKLDTGSPIPRVTRSQGKKNKEATQAQSATPAPKKVTTLAETQVVNKAAAKRRKPNNPPNPPRVRARVKKGVKNTAPPSPNVADLVKTSPHKTTASAMLVNRSQYQVEPASPVPASPRMKVTANPSNRTALHQPGSGFGSHHEDNESNTKPARFSSPKKPTVISKSTKRKIPRKTAKASAISVPKLSGPS